MTETTFNINNYIMVQLTDRGREIHRASHARLYEGYLGEKPPYIPPQEDEEGWSKWQAWSFMSNFGPHMSCGTKLPASPGIKFIT